MDFHVRDKADSLAEFGLGLAKIYLAFSTSFDALPQTRCDTEIRKGRKTANIYIVAQ